MSLHLVDGNLCGSPATIPSTRATERRRDRVGARVAAVVTTLVVAMTTCHDGSPLGPHTAGLPVTLGILAAAARLGRGLGARQMRFLPGVLPTSVVTVAIVWPTPAAAFFSRRRRIDITRRRRRRATRSSTRRPTRQPTRRPTRHPTRQPTRAGTRNPTRPTRSPTRRPTRRPTRSPTTAPTPSFSLRARAIFFPDGLPRSISSGTLVTFTSAIRAGSTQRPTTIARIFRGYTAAGQVSFGLTQTAVSLANGTDFSSSFATVDSATGSVTVFHDRSAVGSEFTLDVTATDAGNSQGTGDITVVSWSYVVDPDADDVLNRTAVPFTFEINGEVLSEDELPPQLALGESYRFNAPGSVAARTVPLSAIHQRYFTHAQGAVTYSLFRVAGGRQGVGSGATNPDLPPPGGDILIDTATGSIFVSPTAMYNVTYELTAADRTRREVRILTWTFATLPADAAVPTNGPNGRGCEHGTIEDNIAFDSQFDCDCFASGFHGDNCEVPDQLPELRIESPGQYIPVGSDPGTFTFYNRSMWAWGQTYQVAPIEIDHVYSIDDDEQEHSVDEDEVIFGIVWAGQAPSRGFFIDVSTGEMLIRIPAVASTTTALLIAETLNTSAAVVANITFEMLPPDVNNPGATGPNGRGCSNGGTKTDTSDGVSEFDGEYRCVCPSGYTGPNCDATISQASSASDDDSDSGSIVAAVVGAIAAVLLVAVAVARLQVYRARRKPVDMSAVQEDILSGLGMGRTALNVGKDEVGLSLQFGESMARHAASVESDTLASEFSTELLSALRGLSGLPNRLNAMLKNKGTVVVVEPADGAALLRMKRPRTYELKEGAEEAFAAVLQRKADRRKLSLREHHFVQDVSVAVPKRVPHELDRQAILRLGVLGEGHFGEVYKATITNSVRGSVALTAAVKTLKTADESGRADLLREAALMALFEHRNIVAILGVVTTPRNMPALLVLEFCENGTLLEHVTLAEPGDLDTTTLLTYCHDVSSGLSYLSSRKIVHRDVAARNVLLDAAQTCKVSDFGMSAAVAGGIDDSDYASHYVKLAGEFPVRWSALEVLTDAKYSKASDVWAFGIVIYEVMSRGSQPYSEFATLAEVAEQIKAGYTMPCPAGCAEAVHERAMLPCWRANPRERPGFTELCRVLVDMGASASRGQHSEANAGNDAAADARRKSSIAVMQADENKTTAEWRVDLKRKNRPLLGPSVHHIKAVLVPAVLNTMKPPKPWKNSAGQPVKPATAATIAHAVEGVIRPAGEGVICPRDGKAGAAYVDTLKMQDDVGRANALLSYTWGYKMVSVGAALLRWTERVGRNPRRTYVWICSLCLNQHRIAKTVVSPDELAGEFGPRVQAIGRILPMLEPWRDPIYLTRAWCLFELYTAIGEHDRVEIDIILTDKENKSFMKAMASEGYGCIDAAFGNIRSEEAEASREEDLNAIRALVQSKPGGFASLNSTVRHHLEGWFQGHGAVRSAHWIDQRKQRSFIGLTSGDSLARMADVNTLTKSYDDSGGNGGMETSSLVDMPKGSNQGRTKNVAKRQSALDDSDAGYLDVGGTEIEVGSRVTVADRGNGVVRYCGPLGDKGFRIGVELDDKVGLNDGSTSMGIRHFSCMAGHGVFVKPQKVALRADDGGTAASAPAPDFEEASFGFPSDLMMSSR